MRTLAVACCLLATACAGVQSPPQNDYRANAMEMLTVSLPAGSIVPYLNALENDPAFSGDSVGLNAQPGYPQRLRAQVATESYIAALDDAREKAKAIADHLGAHLGSPRSVDEVSRGYDGSYLPASGVMLKGSNQSVSVSAPRSVSADPNGVTTLSVSFASDRGTITVFGTYATTQVPPSILNANSLSISFFARGKNLTDAAKRLKSLDAASRALAAKYGAGADRITVTGANINSN